MSFEEDARFVFLKQIVSCFEAGYNLDPFQYSTLRYEEGTMP
jgi:hypothetical protein